MDEADGVQAGEAQPATRCSGGDMEPCDQLKCKRDAAFGIQLAVHSNSISLLRIRIRVSASSVPADRRYVPWLSSLARASSWVKSHLCRRRAWLWCQRVSGSIRVGVAA